MSKTRSEMTKKELGKLRYERHYAHVKDKLLKKYKTRPSDIKQDDWGRRLVMLDFADFQRLMTEYYQTYEKAMVNFYQGLSQITRKA